MANEFKLQTWILAYSSLVFAVTSCGVFSEAALDDWRKLDVFFLRNLLRILFTALSNSLVR